MSPEPAQVLLAKAHNDERLALLVVNNPGVTDEQIGFLAQQAVEKAIRAVLTCRGIRYRRTHDLGELLDLLKGNRILFPPSLEETVILTPFATQMRYDYLPPEDQNESGFDRAAFMRMVRTALQWAKSQISQISM